MSCKCGLPDTIENMIGCEGKNAKGKICDVWKHKSCAKSEMVGKIWLCEKHKPNG